MRIERREVDPERLEIRRRTAREMLRGGSEEEFERYVEERVLTTTLDKAVAWARGNSQCPATVGLACCRDHRSSPHLAAFPVLGIVTKSRSGPQADVGGRWNLATATIYRSGRRHCSMRDRPR